MAAVSCYEPVSHRQWVHQNPLRLWRKAFDPPVTQLAVAAELGVSKTTIQTWEQGGSRPTDDNMQGLRRLTRNPELTREWDEWYLNKPRMLLAAVS